jgi:hypothetical protein
MSIVGKYEAMAIFWRIWGIDFSYLTRRLANCTLDIGVLGNLQNC